MRTSPYRHVRVTAASRLSARLRTLAGLLLGIGSSLAAHGQFPDEPRDALPPLPERRKAVLAEFDQDHDGRLSASERESARRAWAKKMLNQRPERGPFRPPPELLEEFDTNKDGDLDEEEGQKARETLEKRFMQMRKDYDRNGNGRLDPDEIASASSDIDAGKLKGIPKMFLQFAGGGPRRGGPGRGPGGPGAPGGEDADPADLLREADTNHDGKLDAGELAIARTARTKLRDAKLREQTSAPKAQ